MEVVKIAFLTGLSFWLGSIGALGLALVVAPATAATVTHLSVWANHALRLGDGLAECTRRTSSCELPEAICRNRLWSRSLKMISTFASP
jgi:hypothetical protein